MTQGDKELLFKDLCTRLPYEQKVKWRAIDVILSPVMLPVYINEECKPYLRPMSSMTKEEYCEYENYVLNEKDEQIRFCNQLNFYGRYHFDYRGLIPMGLALEATEDMYKN